MVPELIYGVATVYGNQKVWCDLAFVSREQAEAYSEIWQTSLFDGAETSVTPNNIGTASQLWPKNLPFDLVVCFLPEFGKYYLYTLTDNELDALKKYSDKLPPVCKLYPTIRKILVGPKKDTEEISIRLQAWTKEEAIKEFNSLMEEILDKNTCEAYGL